MYYLTRYKFTPYTRRSDHITPVLKRLHWLPVAQRINFKISVITFKVLHNAQPSNLSDIINLHRPPRLLRSCNQNLLSLPRISTVLASRALSLIHRLLSEIRYHPICVHPPPYLDSVLSSRLTFFHLNLFYSSSIASSGFPPQRPRHLLLLVRGVTDSHLNVTEIDVNLILHFYIFFYIKGEQKWEIK